MERLVPFGKYYLLERINVGGMAEVFKAKTVGVEGFEKIVAIKRILPSVAEDEEFIKMFIDEAKITSQLSHANLAQTFDLGKINDAFYIAMEYVPGKDLRAVQERLKRRGERVPISVAAYVIGRVCEGLDYAHRKRDIAGRSLNIVHRDVSPQNVIVSFEGEVKLIDFGIAKAANKITSTQAGILKGKFGYMSPEQVRGMPLDQRSDIFAAGVVLYELCTGERLFTGSSDYSVLEKVQLAKITPPSQLVRDIPARLEQVILKALAREPEERYQHAADLSQDLMRFLIESHTRVVSRDDVAAFMKAVFPDDDARERQGGDAAVDRTRTGARRADGPGEGVRDDQPQRREHHHEPRLREPPTREEPVPAAAGAGPERAAAPRPAAVSEGPRVRAATPASAPSKGPPSRGPRSSPPKLPASLIAGIDLAAEDSNELTPREPARPTTPPAVAQPSAPPLKPPPLGQRSPRPPPIPASPAKTLSSALEAAAAAGVVSPSSPAPWGPRGAGESGAADLLRPPAEDEPTRPMSMEDLAAAERVHIERERGRARSEEEIEVTSPGAPPQMAPAAAVTPAPLVAAGEPIATAAPELTPTDPGSEQEEPTGADVPPSAPAPPPAAAGPARAPRELSRTGRPSRAPAPLPASLFGDTKPSPAAQITDPGGPPAMIPFAAESDDDNTPSARIRRGEPLQAAAPRSGSFSPARPEDRRAPYGGRMQLGKPTLVGDDPSQDDEQTVSLQKKARLRRALQWGAGTLVVVVLGAAWLSVPHKKEELAGPPVASLSVTTVPEDALVLLDGAQVKGPLDRDYNEPKLAAAKEHTLLIRREGFTDQTQPITLAAGEKKTLAIQLQPLPGQLTVRSTPPGAQVFLDNELVGTTPAYLPNVVQEKSHAIALEKHCYRPWQVAVPAHTPKREVVATLEPLFGACPNLKVAPEEKAPDLPVDDPQAMASLGFLNLASRPSASIFVDGVDIGRTTPLVQWPLKVGKHKIRLVLGSKKRELAIEVRSGQTASEIVDLRKR